MRQFYRVYTYSRMMTTGMNVFFHDRENAVAHFHELAKRADVLACDIVENEHGYMSAFALTQTIKLEPMNFED